MPYLQQGYQPRASQNTGANRAAGQQPRAPQSRAPQSRAPQRRSPQKRAAPGRPAPRRKARRGHPLRMFLALAVFAFLATAGVMGYMVYDEINRVEAANTFYPGVFVDDISLNGATPEQAVAEILSRAEAELADWSITIKYGNSDTWTITTDTLGIGAALKNAVITEVNKAFMVGRTGTLIERYQEITKLKTEPYAAYTADVERNMGQIDAILNDIEQRVYIPEQNAEGVFDASRNNPLVVKSESAGQTLDREALRATIAQMVNSMTAGTIDVPVMKVQPSVTSEHFNSQLARLARVTTEIRSNSTAERNMNIQVGCDKFHDKVIKNSEKVSFNKWTGTRTKKNGFYEAREIADNAYTWGVGGGICQVSSTLYGAVVQAGLKVTKRENHGIPVNYVAMGEDATVADRGIDFEFVNNTGADIRITARIISEGKKKYCEVTIYGKPNPNGYTYSFKHKELEQIPIPEEVKTVEDTTGLYVTKVGDSKTVKGAVGHKIQTWIVVKDAHGNVVEEIDMGVDTYAPIPTTVYVKTQ